MQIIDRIAALDTRAREINLSLARICREAGVSLSTIQRWRTAECDPKLHGAERIFQRLERAIGAHEKRIMKKLQGRTGDCRPAA